MVRETAAAINAEGEREMNTRTMALYFDEDSREFAVALSGMRDYGIQLIDNVTEDCFGDYSFTGAETDEEMETMAQNFATESRFEGSDLTNEETARGYYGCFSFLRNKAARE
jgi:hypothetical protein